MSKDLAAMEPLIGRWATSITMLHPTEVAGEKYQAVDTYRWLSGNQVVVHEVEARMGENIVTSLEVYTLKGDKIVSRSFDSTGAVSDYSANLTDGRWRVEGEREKFKSSSIGRVAVEGLWQLKVDGRWIDWMSVRLQRVAAP